MVEHFVRGFNSTVFAYGQTGSGKTYTMFGDLNDKAKKGIIPSAIKDIYSSIKDMGKEDNNKFTNEVIVSCSML
jgi:kinesin family protein 5